MSRNPWGPRPDPKKRVITVSVTAAQDDDFERMKAELDLPTDSAVVKRGLEMLHAALAALAAVPADGETEPLDAVALDALPIGTVLVDPFDSAGDAPVVVCKNANRLWASAPTDLQMITFTSSQVLRIAGDRVRVVYRPIPEGSAD